MRRHTSGKPGGIEARHQPLGCRLLIPGRTVDLPGQEQPLQGLDLEPMGQFARVHMVILDGIAGALDGDLAKAGNCPDEGLLHLFGQGGRNAVGIDRRVIEALRLQEDLV